MNPRQVTDAIEAALSGQDHQALMDLYAEDIVFYSPVTATEFRARPR